ncbi:MAG: chorismate mutase [Lentisphaerae bacterium GWF2_52_8]|nr:MAG: chorismate mutase [Lentisphaerae bacterium GWF2_52_8]
MDLEKLRDKIDDIDHKIVSLLNQRYNCVLEVGHWKKNRSQAIYVPEREKALLERLEKINEGPMPQATLRAIYREIMSGALTLEHPIKIAYLGPEATNSHLAALAKFGHSVEYVPRSGITDVFTDVEAARCAYGCVPIENSTEGAINHTLDMLMDSSVRICSELSLRIHHNLMSKCEQAKIRRIYSHAQVLAQCRSWLQEHMPRVELVESSSTTKAAEAASNEDGTGAIASSLAAELHSLKIHATNIEDNSNNTTRFLVIGAQEPKPTGDDKTSICFALRDRVGALYDCLLPFKNEEITLTMIESRPSKRRNWEYFFFIDLLGHQSDPSVRRALDQLENLVQSLRILGSYPRSSITL